MKFTSLAHNDWIHDYLLLINELAGNLYMAPYSVIASQRIKPF